MNRFAYDNIDLDLTPADRDRALKTRLSGPGTRRKNPDRFDRIEEEAQRAGRKSA